MTGDDAMTVAPGVTPGVAGVGGVPDTYRWWRLPLLRRGTVVTLAKWTGDRAVKMRRAGKAGAIALLVAAAAPAGPAIGQQGLPGWPEGMLDDIDAMAQLPARAFHVVESNGRTVMVSSNGHYAVFNGELWDMWNGFRIRSVEDVERSKAIPLERLGLADSALEGITLQGVAEPPGGRVTVFLDPGAPEGADAVRAARALLARYSFRLVFVPAHEGRQPATQALLCTAAAARAFVLSGTVARQAPAEPRCGLEAMHRNLALVQVLGIDALPFTIAPNGVVLPGAATGYGAFLAANEE